MGTNYLINSTTKKGWLAVFLQDHIQQTPPTLPKVVGSVFAAIGLYWAKLPQPVAILMGMMAVDLFIGTVVAIVLEDFSPKKFRNGILLKSIAFPFLWACHLAEVPLHIGFDLDGYVAMALIAYEFFSVVDTYQKVRPLPKVVDQAIAKVKEMLSAGIPEEKPVKVETTVTGIQKDPLHPENSPVIVQTKTTEMVAATPPVPPAPVIVVVDQDQL